MAHWGVCETGKKKGGRVLYSDICRKGLGGQIVSAKAKSVSFSDKEDLTHSSQIGGHHIIDVPLPAKESGSRPEQTGTQPPEAAGYRSADSCMQAVTQPAPSYSSVPFSSREPTPGRRARWVAATESSGGRGKFFNSASRMPSRGLGFGKRTLKALDLFSGTGSVGNQLSKWGFQVTTLDNSPNCKANLCLDILEWDYKRQYSPGFFQVITASVPCEEYSPAKTTQVRDLGKADILAKKVLEIVAYFNPDLWWIENPRKGWLRHREFMQGLPFVDLDYCQFSEWGYQKPTRFWGSPQLGRLHNVLCDFQNCINIIEDDNGHWHHRERLGGYKMVYSTKDKGRVPSSAVDYLLGSTYHWENGVVRRFSTWQRAQPVRIQEIEKNDENISDQGISDDECSDSSSEFCSAEKKVTHPEKVWVIPQRLCKSWDSYCVNSLQKKEKEYMLTLLLKVTSLGGRQKFIRALVDTGAQVNLIRNGLFSPNEFQRANSPLTLVAANGQVLEGGKCTIDLCMKFYQSSEVVDVEPEVELDGEFFEANIGIDAILSYPWCKKHHLAVVPHLKCLAIVQPNLVFIHGEKRRAVTKLQNTTINCVQAGQQSNLPKYRLQKWAVHSAWDFFHQRPDIDVFADAQRHECPAWWGPKGTFEEPFQQDWGINSILWMNPAPHLLEKVVDKIALDKAKVMLVCPRWLSRRY